MPLAARKWTSPLVAALLAIAVGVGTRADETGSGPADEGDGRIVAVVNGKALTLGAFKDYLLRQIGESYIEVFVNEALVEQEAARSGVSASADDEAAWIEARIAEIRRNPQMAGQDLDEIRRRYRPHARVGFLLETLIRRERRGEDVVRSLYEEKYGERRKARHILYAVQPPDDADEATKQALWEEARGKAARAVAMLKKGAEFADLARRESEDPASARRGGALPTFGRSDTVGGFADACFSLEPGKVSDPVRSEYGWHVIEVLEVRPASRALDEATKKELLAEAAIRPVTNQELQTYLDGLRAKAEIEVRLP